MGTFLTPVRGSPPYFARVTALAMLSSVVGTHAAASESAAEQRFQMTGSASLRLDQPVQADGLVRLKAYLTPKDAAIAELPPVQEGGDFAMIARATSAAAVCTNDTIFRDDFDGDGG